MGLKSRAEQKDTLDYLPMRSVNNGHRPRPMSANASVQSSATIDPEDEIAALGRRRGFSEEQGSYVVLMVRVFFGLTRGH